MTNATLEHTGANAGRETIQPQAASPSHVAEQIAQGYHFTLSTGTNLKRWFTQVVLTPDPAAAARLISQILIPDQAWFWTREWQEAEATVTAECEAGLGEFFANEDEFLADLDR